MKTMLDVANEAGVSVATVSRYLNKTGYVNSETAKSIERACEKLGYTISSNKRRSGKKNRNTKIGIVTTDIRNSFYTDVIGVVQEVAKESGHDVIICDSHNSTDAEIRNISMLQSEVGGMIVIPVSQVAAYNGAYLKEINDQRIPVVLVDREYSNVHLDGVFVDGFQGTYEGVVGLIRQGHKKIMCVTGSMSTKPGIDRLNGYLQALKDNGLPVEENLILYSDFDSQKAYLNVMKTLPHARQVTAVFSSNLYMGLGTLRAIDELGLRIPDDIAFMTFDDYPMFNFQKNNISIIRNPWRDIGEEAARILLEKMGMKRKQKSSAARRIMLSAEVILRGSEQYLPGQEKRKKQSPRFLS